LKNEGSSKRMVVLKRETSKKVYWMKGSNTGHKDREGVWGRGGNPKRETFLGGDDDTKEIQKIKKSSKKIVLEKKISKRKDFHRKKKESCIMGQGKGPKKTSTRKNKEEMTR